MWSLWKICNKSKAESYCTYENSFNEEWEHCIRIALSLGKNANYLFSFKYSSEINGFYTKHFKTQTIKFKYLISKHFMRRRNRGNAFCVAIFLVSLYNLCCFIRIPFYNTYISWTNDVSKNLPLKFCIGLFLWNTLQIYSM